MRFKEPASESDLQAFQEKLKITLPAEYISFMLLHNGAEGPIGEYAFLAIWSTDEISEFYHDDMLKDILPGYFFFASDRSGYLFAFDCHSIENRIVRVPDDIEELSEITVIANSFGEFINYIHNLDFSEDMSQIKEGEV